jgi:hypothetical protein
MENINFLLEEKVYEKVHENESENKILDELKQTFIEEDQTDVLSSSALAELEYYYKMYKNVKQLGQILQFYKIQKGKMIKDEMIQMILFFEMDPNNKALVQRRMRLWKNIEELKNDTYFSNYILF